MFKTKITILACNVFLKHAYLSMKRILQLKKKKLLLPVWLFHFEFFLSNVKITYHLFSFEEIVFERFNAM